MLHQRYLEILKEWVEVNSHTQHVDGVREVLKLIEREAILAGLKIQHHQDALFGTFGSGNFCITLVCHADTVFPCESAFQKFTVNDDYATGPGVIDDKGGILVSLLAIESLMANFPAGVTLQWICTPSEETGSQGYHDWLKELGEKSNLVLGFEPAMEDGSIICARRGNKWFQLDVQGAGGHAGRDFTKVLNPAHEAILFADRATRLSNLEEGYSVAITGLETNTTVFNSIPSQSLVRLDARYEKDEQGQFLLKKITDLSNEHALLPNKNQTELKKTLTLHENCPAFSRTQEVQPLLELALTLIEKIEGKKVNAIRSGGSADSNYMSRPGLPIIDGLGPLGSGMHTEKETVYIPSLLTRARIVAEFIKQAKFSH